MIAYTIFFLLAPVSQALKISLVSVGGQNESWNICAAAEQALPATGDVSSVQIPRILHQTYKSTDLPPGFKRFRDSWLQQTDGWQHHIWTDEDNRKLVEEHYPWFLSTYDTYQYPIEKVDAARYFMLHRYGGIYADLDIEALRDPTPLISGGHVLAFFYEWDAGPDRISNALMASTPGNPFWMYLAHHMIETKAMSEAMPVYDPRWEQVIRVFAATGPKMFHEAVHTYRKANPGVRANIFPKKYWTPYGPDGASEQAVRSDPCQEMGREMCMATNPDAILVSHWTGSWEVCSSETLHNSDYCVKRRQATKCMSECCL